MAREKLAYWNVFCDNSNKEENSFDLLKEDWNHLETKIRVYVEDVMAMNESEDDEVDEE